MAIRHATFCLAGHYRDSLMAHLQRWHQVKGQVFHGGVHVQERPGQVQELEFRQRQQLSGISSQEWRRRIVLICSIFDLVGEHEDICEVQRVQGGRTTQFVR